ECSDLRLIFLTTVIAGEIVGERVAKACLLGRLAVQVEKCLTDARDVVVLAGLDLAVRGKDAGYPTDRNARFPREPRRETQLLRSSFRLFVRIRWTGQACERSSALAGPKVGRGIGQELDEVAVEIRAVTRIRVLPEEIARHGCHVRPSQIVLDGQAGYGHGVSARFGHELVLHVAAERGIENGGVARSKALREHRG